MKIFILLALLLAIIVVGYMWYLTKKSPSIMNGGYDAEMQKNTGVPKGK
ncbi:MAG: hypothetical protein JWO84_104 [Parcubacteria group bacterium]|nr:hypothetical protein [Parcubacteria group bacterium]